MAVVMLANAVPVEMNYGYDDEVLGYYQDDLIEAESKQQAHRPQPAAPAPKPKPAAPPVQPPPMKKPHPAPVQQQYPPAPPPMTGGKKKHQG